ncbi:MAG: malonyl-ACP O-methyltransferase BioC [Aliidiomarina sp.]|uniref:malonyl-ACP O-methyltransferase BioC n=1 Tax=Aliidiomarina sp. TaxID=1872439 RepID=UPI0025C1E289|nr:malonyl-ACP O-methyltransferase BioC [Aliidiomarina sp.]MCH8500302.1 malonyl-ACP O-methyltransferase BioC [Aliidiomarina sp.]
MLCIDNKTAVANRFSRAAARYQNHCQVQDQVAERLLTLAARHGTLQQPLRLLDLGCGPGSQQHRLHEHFGFGPTSHYIGVDIAAAMLDVAQQRIENIAPPCSRDFICADAEQLPLAAAQVDVIYSNMALQWCQNPDAVLRECARVLSPNGYALVSVVLPQSLQPLRQLMGREQSRHPEFATWQRAVSNCGLKSLACTVEQVTSYYPDVNAVVKSISGVGADAHAQPVTNNAHGQSSRLNRSNLMKLRQDYEGFRTSKGLPLHYHIGFFVLTAE